MGMGRGRSCMILQNDQMTTLENFKNTGPGHPDCCMTQPKPFKSDRLAEFKLQAWVVLATVLLAATWTGNKLLSKTKLNFGILHDSLAFFAEVHGCQDFMTLPLQPGSAQKQALRNVSTISPSSEMTTAGASQLQTNMATGMLTRVAC